LFTWQHPHFYAIALMHREDYKRGGLKMLPVIDPEGNRTFRQIIVYSILLILVSILPTVIGLAGMTYFIGALILGGFMMATGLILCLSKKDKDARRLFKASLVYLPMLLVLFVIDLGVF